MKIRNRGFHDKLNNGKRGHVCGKGGFTLVELIVVIVILLILATGGVVGVTKWISWSRFNEQEEYARTIYLAAQNQLTEYAANGQLKTKIWEPLSDGDGGFINLMDFDSLKLVDSDGNPITPDSIWCARAGKSTDTTARYTGDVCYVMGTSDMFALYQQNPAAVDKKVRMLYDLITPYLYDTSILDASVCVEFTPEDGQVFEVFYSNVEPNKSDTFTFAASGATSGGVSIHSREESCRREQMIGYYGVRTLSKAPTPYTESPSVTDVTLHNEETLYLSFRYNRIKAAINFMTYTITVCDADNANVRRMEVILDGAALSAADTETDYQAVDCTVIRYGTDGVTKLDYDAGNGTYGRTYPFLVKQQSDNTVCIILDAADLTATAHHYGAVKNGLEADGVLSDGSDAKKYMSTYSFGRFGLDVDSASCSVEGNSTLYKQLTKKQSNSSAVFFATPLNPPAAGADGSAANPFTYEIENARHLYNIRYFEQTLDSGDYREYVLTGSMDWREFIDGKNLYDSGNLYGKAENVSAAAHTPVSDVKTVFPSVAALGEKAVFRSKDSALPCTINGLVCTESGNETASVYGVELDPVTNVNVNKPHGPVGLFATNKGTITDVALDKVQTTGTDHVGAFCGRNEGTLQNLQALNSKPNDAAYASSVTGKTNVGGVTGSTATKASGSNVYKNLKNAATVTGETCVGGIVGQISLPEEAAGTVLVKDCMNYGEVKAAAVSPETDLEAARYIGGIVGYAENLKADSPESVTLSDCGYLPQVNGVQVLPTGAEALLMKCSGKYVGGIVGYNENAVLENCFAKTQDGQDGFLFGHTYVGGIAGYNDGLIYADTATTMAVNVYGNDYVGGAAGYNGGKIYGTSAASEITVTGDVYGNDYVGGAAGYNGGKIYGTSAASEITVTGDVYGNDYVGGVVGCEAADAALQYVLYDGGTVCGGTRAAAGAGGAAEKGGVFAGGIAGFNASGQLLTDTTVQADAALVQGNFCVGGVIGASIVAPLGDLYAKWDSAAFGGAVDAKAFAGGYIGYHALIADASETQNAANALLGAFEGQSDMSYEKIIERVNQHGTKGIATGTFAEVGNRLTVAGVQGTGSTITGSVTADVYVGGVVGYNAANTTLYLSAIDNALTVRANGGVAAPAENTNGFANRLYATLHPESTTIPDQYMYTYAGGLIGKATPYMVIDHCTNANTVLFDTAGTFMGGLCEINEGKLQNCVVRSIADAEHGFVGGLTGLNKGTIIDCTFEEGCLIAGAECVGGIAAENYGTIQGITQTQIYQVQAADSSGNVLGNYAGGIAAANGGLIDNCSVNLVIFGNYAGGIVGFNTDAGMNNEDGTVSENPGKVYNCTVTADIIDEVSGVGSDQATPGIAGINYGIITGCTYKGNLTEGTEGS